ncbi:hypothetical protein KP509_35G066500 [Ceratopteris richardii]|uniref:Uncharacterized protein n=1 Tax=Ceratopteris richardii TaxID=49495 RepID=A0A8T2QJ34_CERRI|nr:hypothetical protein KP509_35G066500 [Ceratopteris richardii]
MFYSHFILARKGPLGVIWVAAHLEAKLRKKHVAETSISESVDSIICSEVPLALRLSGHLLVGVVRIYSRKVNYLYHDCSEALIKIKNAFLPSNVDLPPEASKVPFHSITLPEPFALDDFDSSLKWEKVHSAATGDFAEFHISERDIITLREQADDEARGPLFDLDERFQDYTEDPYSLLYERDKPLSSPMNVSLESEIEVALEEDVLPPLPANEAMELDREQLDDERDVYTPIHDQLLESGGTSESSGRIRKRKADSSLVTSRSTQDIPEIEKLRAAPESNVLEPLLMELDEEEVRNSSILKTRRTEGGSLNEFASLDVQATPLLNEILSPTITSSPATAAGVSSGYTGNEDLLGEILGARTPAFKVATGGAVPQPVEQKRRLRKRKSIFDDRPILSSSLMKKQLSGARDLLRKRRKCPLTEFRMRKSSNKFVESRFFMPSFTGLSSLKDFYNCIVGLPTFEGIGASPIDVRPQIFSDTGAETIAELPETVISPVDFEETPLYLHNSPLQLIQHTPIIHPLEETNYETTEGHQGICAPELGPEQELQGADNSYVCNKHLTASSGQDDDTLHHAEDFTNQALLSGEKMVTERHSLSPPLIHGEASTAKSSDAALPKLDFLDESRDTNSSPSGDGMQDPFIDESEAGRRTDRSSNSSYSWSVRTKFVAKYLKSVFEEKETMARSQSVQVSLESLLEGRSRKEAARLYFETLVLKSRDYIDVKQKTGFAEIMLSSTPFLRKDSLI